MTANTSLFITAGASGVTCPARSPQSGGGNGAKGLKLVSDYCCPVGAPGGAGPRCSCGSDAVCQPLLQEGDRGVGAALSPSPGRGRAAAFPFTQGLTPSPWKQGRGGHPRVRGHVPCMPAAACGAPRNASAQTGLPAVPSCAELPRLFAMHSSQV